MTDNHLGNTRRKIRALLAKTTATSGCTPGEKKSAIEMARDIANKKLPGSDIIFDEIVQAEKDLKGDVPPTVAEAKAAAKKTAKPNADKPKKVTRAETIMTMMARKEGVSIAELQAIFKTEAHTVRAQISVESRKAGIKPVLKDGRYYKTAPEAK
jgi:hypothetical protein